MEGPDLPEPLAGLHRLAHNVWWCWNPDAEALFERLDADTWKACHHNPVALLHRVDVDTLAERAADRSYVKALQNVLTRLDNYVELAGSEDVTPGATVDGPTPERPVAYFCAEYGLHAGIPMYSGGLGVLAGDHLKSASDLGLPLVAVGLFYRLGYMTQHLSVTGEQLVEDHEYDPRSLGLQPVPGDDGSPLELRLAMADREILVRAWSLAVGRITLYLLDTNVEPNAPDDREITRRLYGGDGERRIQQELVLGRAGVHLLCALGITPSVFHMNEGHAAFSSLERAARMVREEGLSFADAQARIRATTMFTTHTPVPAGHDRFDAELVGRYLGATPDELGISWDEFFALGRTQESPEGEFNMTVLALHFAGYTNGVSELHGKASQWLLRAFWPDLDEHDVPIDAITNGIHLATWTHPEVRALLGRPTGWLRGEDFTDAERVDPAALWSAHRKAKHELVDHATGAVRRAFTERGESPLVLDGTLAGLDPEALYIGFARRFATYKRAHLVFSDLERLAALLDAPGRPIRLLIAGKAHPRDDKGRSVLAEITRHARSDLLLGKVIFLEDYDMLLARYLVRGVDVWLNNPVRMMEASGTSGMKSAANGGLNLSIGDGWWPEAYDGKNGWLLAGDQQVDDPEEQDRIDSDALYTMLEHEVAALYYDRDQHGVPRGWVERMAHCLATIPPVFNTDRMVSDYLERGYGPLARAVVAR